MSIVIRACDEGSVDVLNYLIGVHVVYVLFVNKGQLSHHNFHITQLLQIVSHTLPVVRYVLSLGSYFSRY